MRHERRTEELFDLLFEVGPICTRELGEIVGLTQNECAVYVSELHRLYGIVHIAAWEAGRNGPRALYAWGPGDDARKPKPKTNSEKNRAWRQRNRYRVNSVFGLAIPIDRRHKSIPKSRGCAASNCG